MKPYMFMTVLIAAAWLVPVSPAQSAASKSKPINTTCPISGEPIAPSAGVIEYKDHTIGFCCAGCSRAFLAWDDARKDRFVAMAMRGEEPDHTPQKEHVESGTTQPAAASFPYPLDTCIVSGEKLGSMGDPVVKQYDGREVRLCCAACVDTFESDQEQYMGKIDETIVEARLMHYPIDTCIVAGGKLGSMGDPVNLVYNNRLVRFCCAGCEPGFKDDPAKYFEALDKKIIEQQTKTYPLTTCVVAGAELGSMGDPVDYVFGNRLVRFCCASCIKKFEAEPGKYMATIDTSYADAQRASYPLNTCVVAGGELGSMGEPVELVAGTQLVRFCCKGCFPAFRKDPQKYLAMLKQD
jgi:YHS domain-containing protein